MLPIVKSRDVRDPTYDQLKGIRLDSWTLWFIVAGDSHPLLAFSFHGTIVSARPICIKASNGLGAFASLPSPSWQFWKVLGKICDLSDFFVAWAPVRICSRAREGDGSMHIVEKGFKTRGNSPERWGCFVSCTRPLAH